MVGGWVGVHQGVTRHWLVRDGTVKGRKELPRGDYRNRAGAMSCSARPSNVCKMLPPPSAELFLGSLQLSASHPLSWPFQLFKRFQLCPCVEQMQPTSPHHALCAIDVQDPRQRHVLATPQSTQVFFDPSPNSNHSPVKSVRADGRSAMGGSQMTVPN